ncbi:peptidase associated/transthyretin-like domain-containing protein [Saccharicrinis fermentans]|uniref:Putative lipoprotein n=1 Tax=Saccharicrinis fermentans DSM 9555 = JCM 21142 TaxID=869213 RepID=W7Y5S3_9BACT|nr:hypothetical protein [Saccharicrinis fermentans]GAF02948.1 putative lipoprotein [Saccharicrinis fermentans DSM 9555 = JCM 21142]
MNKKIIRKILGALSFTSVMFVFQACYGTPQDYGLDVRLEGKVKSAKTGLPIKGIQVSVNEEYQYTVTDDSGFYSFYVPFLDSLTVSFKDIDSLENGSYLPKDTILNAREEEMVLNISLNEE